MNSSTISATYWKVWWALIGPPWSGKSTLARIISERCPKYRYHDHDDDWLDPTIQTKLWHSSIDDAVKKMGDQAFLQFEWKFTIENYGRADENPKFSLDGVLFASSGSLVRSEKAIEHIRERTYIILLDVPINTVLDQIRKRQWGAWRIIGINGWPNGEEPKHKSLEDELRFRYELYQTYQDSILEHHPGEIPNKTAQRLLVHIRNLSREIYS